MTSGVVRRKCRGLGLGRAWPLLVVGLACASGNQPVTLRTMMGSTVEMRLESNVPDTVFRVREQRVDAGPEEGWEAVGRGSAVVVSLRAERRYELSAKPPGYEERRVRITEPLPRFAFRFVEAHRIEEAPSRPAPSPDPGPPLPDFAVADFEVTGIDPSEARGVDFGRYHALVIGNNHYQKVQGLMTAEADADAVAQVLGEEYGFEVMLIKNATRSQMIAGFERARRKLTRRDNLLIYYAGHGYYDEDTERGYWLPVDADEHSRANWISNADITDSLRAIPAKHVMVVADSCFSGTLTRGISIAGRGSGYVRRMLSKRARVVITSGGLEPVEDGGGSGHSVFAKAFLDALRDNDELIDGSGLFARIRRPVVLESPQTPEYGDIRFTGHEGGDFLFLPRR